MDVNERATRKAFTHLLRCPQAWHLRGLTYDDQVQRIMSLPADVRILILRFVPVEDDPILAVAFADPDGSSLAKMARLYGCTREYMRQIDEKAIARLRRDGRLESFADAKDRVTAWDEMAWR